MSAVNTKGAVIIGDSTVIAYLHYIDKYAIFGSILLIMWVGGFKNGEKYAYVIKVWPLIRHIQAKKQFVLGDFKLVY